MADSTKHTTPDAALGIAWWNAMSERARLAALKAVEPEGRASPAEAWAHWKEPMAGFLSSSSAPWTRSFQPAALRNL